MNGILRVINVFLASPGDLQKERQFANEAVEEVNKVIAPYFNFRVELKGWEDTLPGSGRPQSIINQELNNCELFIGIMWKKWGTPPSKTGQYSSGFEEEFELSFERHRKTGSPDMAMYFKKIPSEFMTDPGKDLIKVLEFQNRLISGKSILFKEFSDSNEFQKYVRQKITDYLINLNNTEKENLEEKQAKTKTNADSMEYQQDKEIIKSPFSHEGHTFLKKILEKTELSNSDEELTSLEIARFRLLSSIIYKPGNNELFLGVHDANIIFLNGDTKYGKQEISRLVDCALKYISHENTPFWNWYKKYMKITKNELILFNLSFSSNSDTKIGALHVMKIIGLMLPINGEYFTRTDFIHLNWLSEKNSDDEKVAALNYLKYHGIEEDVASIQIELDKANSKTLRMSLEAIICIQLRYKKENALITALKNHFEKFDENLLSKLLSIVSIIDNDSLKLGLKHRNREIRLESLKILKKRKKLNLEEMRELKNDPFSLIRKEIIDLILSDNQQLNDEEIKKTLINPQNRDETNLLVPTPIDEQGKECYDEYLFSKYSKMPESKLLELTNEFRDIDFISYFALCNRYFKNHSEKLRENVDDQFKSYFAFYIKNLINIGISEDEAKSWWHLESFVRKNLTRKGLDILCDKGNFNDLNRIRKNIYSDYTQSSIVELEYMYKFGEWEDIPFIVKTKQHFKPKIILSKYFLKKNWNYFIAKTIYKIGGNRIEEMFKIDMPSNIFGELIKTCSLAKFSKISDAGLLDLLKNKDDKIRKFASLKIIQSFNKRKLKFYIDTYVKNGEIRYYNVWFWLDFGFSMTKTIINRAIALIINE